MTDLAAIHRRWSTYGGMGNPRGAEDYTDAGCRVLAEHAFRDVNDLLHYIEQHALANGGCIPAPAYKEACDVLNAVQAVVEHARKISPSERAIVYVADVERALGLDAPTPHKMGGNDV